MITAANNSSKNILIARLFIFSPRLVICAYNFNTIIKQKAKKIRGGRQFHSPTSSYFSLVFTFKFNILLPVFVIINLL